MGFSGMQPVWPRKRQRPTIGLERRIAPIALVLNFEKIAMEGDVHVDSIYRMTQARNIFCHLVRGNQEWKFRDRDQTVRMDNAERRSSDVLQGMQECEPSTVGDEFTANRNFRNGLKGSVRTCLENQPQAQRAF